MAALPLPELLTHLTPQEKLFFDYIDAQLDKIELFFMDREKELLIRTKTLREQLSELQHHREFVHARLWRIHFSILWYLIFFFFQKVNDEEISWISAIVTALKLKLRSYPVIEISTHDHPANNELRRTSLVSATTAREAYWLKLNSRVRVKICVQCVHLRHPQCVPVPAMKDRGLELVVQGWMAYLPN